MFLQQFEKFIDQHRLARRDALGKQGVVDARSLRWETSQRSGGKRSETPGW